MPTRNVNLTDHHNHFVEGRIASGRFKNASELMRAGLRLRGWYTQSLRYPTHADAITASRRRRFCQEIPAFSGYGLSGMR